MRDVRGLFGGFHALVGRIPLLFMYGYYFACVGAATYVFVFLVVSHHAFVAAYVALAAGVLAATLMTAFERISRRRP
jgi:hypothetical protein